MPEAHSPYTLLLQLNQDYLQKKHHYFLRGDTYRIDRATNRELPRLRQESVSPEHSSQCRILLDSNSANLV